MMERDTHFTAAGLLYSLQYKDGDFGSIALVSGQPQRAQACLAYLENPVKNFTFFGYTFWTGLYKGQKVTVGNGGFYSPDSAFVTELLCEGGVQTFIRLGSCGALREDIKVGDLIVADKAIRGDGVTGYYVDDDFVPIADEGVTQQLLDTCQGKVGAHKGGMWTTDALFRETKEIVNKQIEKGAIGVDMVTSPFFTLANINNRRTSAILAVSDNAITGEMGFANIRFLDAQNTMIDVAFDVAGNILSQPVNPKENASAQIAWDPQTEEKFKATIAKMPLMQRRIAEKMVSKRAVKLAQEQNKSCVTEEEMVVAFFKEVPPMFQKAMKDLLTEAGVAYEQYAQGK